MYQQITLIGNVGRNADLRYTPTGTAVCDFSIAVTERWGKGDDKKEQTTWFKVTIWREFAESMADHIKKGKKLFVVGTVKATAYTDKGGKPAASLEVTASTIKFLDRVHDDGARSDQDVSENEVGDMAF